jgi:hypothetical protein
MKNTNDNSDDQTGDITPNQILMAWNEGLNLKQISDRFQIPIDIVNRSLKRSLKALSGHGVRTQVQKNIT